MRVGGGGVFLGPQHEVEVVRRVDGIVDVTVGRYHFLCNVNNGTGQKKILLIGVVPVQSLSATAVAV